MTDIPLLSLTIFLPLLFLFKTFSLSSIPKPGDARPFDLLGIPLILLRTEKNKIKVYHNVCSHRGYKILQKKCSIKNVIRCPYHSWSYNLEGELVSTPHLGGMNKHEAKDFDRSVSGLKEVRSFVWLDMIIVNISKNEVCLLYTSPSPRDS